jgi:hypothetical protein
MAVRNYGPPTVVVAVPAAPGRGGGLTISEVRPAMRSPSCLENPMWKKTTKERYNEKLDHMIPTAMTDCGFLVGEQDAHNTERQPRYTAFVRINDQFFESTAPITINEFDSLKTSDVEADG